MQRSLWSVCLFLLLLWGCGGGGSSSSNIPPPAIQLSIAPSTVSLPIAGTQTFSSTVTGTSNTAVTWSIQEGSAGGTVTSAGLYTAPATAGTYHVVATSQADATVKTTVTVTVSHTAVVTLTPITLSLPVSGTKTFATTVTGATNKAVTWSVQEGAAGGTVTSAGLYTAPNTAGIYHVVATSQEDPTVKATSTVTVYPTVTVNPTAITLTLLDTRTFTATVKGVTDTSVTWSVQEGAAGGTITSAGLYTAPSAPGTYHIIATSKADTSRNAVATVTIEAGSASGTVQ